MKYRDRGARKVEKGGGREDPEALGKSRGQTGKPTDHPEKCVWFGILLFFFFFFFFLGVHLRV